VHVCRREGGMDFMARMLLLSSGMQTVLHCPPCEAGGGIYCADQEVSHVWSRSEAQEKPNQIYLLASSRCELQC